MNSVQLKFHSIVLSITTLLFFSIYEASYKLIEIHPVYKVILSGLVSLALYRVIAKLFYLLTKKSKLLRKLLLGPKYLEGTWVGFYIGQTGRVRYIVERFEQDIFQLIILGHSYKDDLTYHTNWTSKPVNINDIDAEISYMYDLRGIDENMNGNGVAFFNLRRTSTDKAAYAFKGFSADLHNPHRTRASELKISDDHCISDDDAKLKAIEFYNTNPIF